MSLWVYELADQLQAPSMEQSNGRKLTLRDRIRHNILPSDTERQEIIDAVTAADKRLSEIRASATFAAYDVEEHTLCEYISDYSSMIAPIRSLSDDLLEKIFLDPEIHGIVNIGKINPSAAVDGHNPYILASVSHHWRCVVFQVPWLWSSFHISGFRNDCRVLRDLQRCLERSRDLALTIVLDFGWKLPPNVKILEAIMQHAERWLNFTITTPSPGLADYLHLFAPVRRRMHRLEHISFLLTGSDDIDDRANLDAFKEAPNLRSVGLDSLHSIEQIPLLPFHQIRTVSIRQSNSAVCNKVLQILFPHADNITSVEVSEDFFRPEFPSRTEPHLYPEMRKLTIIDRKDRSSKTMDILHRLTTPNLDRLSLANFFLWKGQTSLMPFIRRSACQLKTLVLKDMRLRPMELLALLRMLPTLEILIITELLPNSVTDLVLEALTPRPKPDCLFRTDVLLRMLEGRTSSLAIVDITLPRREVGPVDRARFAALRLAYTSLRIQRMAPSGSPMDVQELVDYCIDFHFASAPELKACALVSRSWTQTAQMHLFNHVIIGSPGFYQTNLPSLNRLRCSRLFEVLNASSRLIRWIESIQIHLNTVPPDVLDILSTFPLVRLRRIVVAGTWSPRSVSVIDAIQELLSLGTLTELSISGNFDYLSEFTQVLERCSPNIKEVSFCAVQIGRRSANALGDLPPSERRIEVNGLDLSWSEGIHDWLNSPQCPFDFTNLKRLRLHENTSLLQWPAFAPSIPRVEHLQFQPRIPGPPLIDLAPFTNLKSIEILVTNEYDVSLALQVLSTMAPLNHIHTLRLRLPHTGIPDADLGAEIDTQIVALPLPHLQAVELVYRPAARARIMKRLPLLNARKLVRLYFAGVRRWQTGHIPIDPKIQ
ncbi:hypothetical protein DFH09DRAFT_1371364 [Mycena vulgaris]|nr:hypothetical protein DFH09DRAFT_1371364 [Mycena vulgaris]